VLPPPPRAGEPPVTNTRNNTLSPHWRMWLKPENRHPVLANSFAEYAADVAAPEQAQSIARSREIVRG